MKIRVTGMSPIAAAVSLALGSGFALAQERDDPLADREPPIEQSSQERRPESNTDASVRAAEQQQEQDALTSESHGGFEEIVAQNPELSSFVEAVNASGLAEALTSGSDYTIFAPTNDALEGENIDSLLEQENQQELVALLRAHIVADDVDREMASRIGQAQTIDGGIVDISVEEEKLMVGDAEAMDGEIKIGNLRVYAVDSILPRNPLPQTASNTTQRPGDESRSTLGDQRSSVEVPDPEPRPQ